MSSLRGWLTGRKTYLLAGSLLLATIVLLLAGKLTPPTALALIMIAVCGFPATFRAALKRHRAEELALLADIARTGAAMLARDTSAALAGVGQVCEHGQKLYSDCNEETEI